MKRLILLSLITAASSLTVMYALDHWYRSLYKLDYDAAENVFPAPSISETYQIVKVGNSHSQDGISFQGYNIKSLDVSGVAQKYETDLALLKHHRRQIEKNALIIIPV